MQNYLSSILLVVFAFAGRTVLAQSHYQCQYSDLNLKKNIKPIGKMAKNDSAAISLTNKLFMTLATQRRLKLDALYSCRGVTTFIAYYDSVKADRIIFYPESYIFTNIEATDWPAKGALFHAIAHLQHNHADKFAFSRLELEADSLAAIWLKQSGATFQEAIKYLEINASAKMPGYSKRIKLFKKIYPKSPPIPATPLPEIPQPATLKPKAKFTVTCTNNCIAPCELFIASTSENTVSGTCYEWNGIERGDHFTWTYVQSAKFLLTLEVINPDGQRNKFTDSIMVSPPLIDHRHRQLNKN